MVNLIRRVARVEILDDETTPFEEAHRTAPKDANNSGVPRFGSTLCFPIPRGPRPNPVLTNRKVHTKTHLAED